MTHIATQSEISKARELVAKLDAESDALPLDTPRWRELIWAAQNVRGWLFHAERGVSVRCKFAALAPSR